MGRHGKSKQHTYICTPGCLRGFDQSQALRSHRAQSGACAEKWRASIYQQMDAELRARQQRVQQEVERDAPPDEPMQDAPQEPVPTIPSGNSVPQEAMNWEPEYNEMDPGPQS